MRIEPTPRRELILRRLVAAKQSADGLLTYTKFTIPDPATRGDVRVSRYQIAKHHEVLSDALHKIESGAYTRVIINCAPRHGKTELASKRMLSWYSARHPEKSLIFGTYNDTFAEDIGRAVRGIIQSPEHKLAFPKHALKDGSMSAKRLETQQGGMLAFVGRGGTITGRGGDGIVIDDPIKDRQEADSKIIRDQLWSWFTQVVSTRLMTKDGWIMLIQTRWHEDDLVGRLTDPLNSYYDPVEAKRWVVIDLPALALDDEDILGRKEGEALWPERFPRDFLLKQKRLDPRGFQALYQGRPSSTSGNFFAVSWLRTYKPDELPKNLRYYVASDHAVSTRQDRDKTVLLPIGLDENENIYILPDVFWQAAASDKVVEAMLRTMQRRKPVFWWAERGHISKAIGPFLRKRMQEENTYCSLIEVTPVADKQTRAQSIQGRMAMGRVFFPEFAPWWPEAKDQILKFPQGAHDDFVDALAYIGLGLNQQTSQHTHDSGRSFGLPGSFARMFHEIRQHENHNRRNTGGW